MLPTYLHQLRLLAAAASPEHMARALPATSVVDGALASANPRALDGLHGRDVYLVFLESVGAVVYDDERAVRVLGPARDRLAADIAAAGLQVVSAFVRSPTIGGGSDLAHVSLLSGIDLSDPRRHDLLLTTTRPTLISVFRAHGYETFGFYPSVSWDWPERAWYGYDQYVEGRSLDYRGPTFDNWWKIPDQFSFARFEQLYPRDARTPPRFVFAATISTHVPFIRVPPYQPDWQRVLGEQPFDEADVTREMARPVDWIDMMPVYARLVDYTDRWIGGYLRQPRPRDTVYVLVGDHQPTANVSGEGRVVVRSGARDLVVSATAAALRRAGIRRRAGAAARAARWHARADRDAAAGVRAGRSALILLDGFLRVPDRGRPPRAVLATSRWPGVTGRGPPGPYGRPTNPIQVKEKP